MRTLALLFGPFPLLLLCAVPVGATYPYGYVNSHGYTYRGNGYWYYGNQAYTYSSVYYPAGYYGGYYYGAGYYPVYTPYYPPAQPAPPSPQTSSDWKSELIRYKAKLDDNKLYLEAAQAMGIPTQGGGYGNPGYQANLIPQGSTQYGYSLQTAINAIGDNSNALMVQGLNRALEQQQSNTASFFQQYNGTVQQNSAALGRFLEKMAEADKIRATGDSNSKVLSASHGNSTTVTTTQTGTGTAQPATPALADRTAVVGLQVLQNRCASCHEGEKARAGFRVSAWNSYNREQKMAVKRAVINEDLKRRMPQDAQGNHVPIPDAEVDAITALK